MPRPKKTSSQPKRKIKKSAKVIEKIYPEFIENFKKEIKEKTPFTLKIDQYGGENCYHVGVLKENGPRKHCIWMVGFATGPEFLKPFWTSMAFKSFVKD